MVEKVKNTAVDELISVLKSRYVGDELIKITSAYEMAVKGHVAQKRKSGEPYIVHPISVAIYLSDLSMDIDTVIAALLHDLIEDTEITYEDIKTSFGTDVANIVDGVTKLDRIRYNTKEEAQADAIRKMVVAMSKDIRVLILKLADRLHNIETLEHLHDWKQEKIANETLYVYAPLAHRLGLQNIKHTLEDTSFEILFKKQNIEIEKLIEKTSPHRNSEIKKIYVWLVANKLTLNIKKSKFMIISKRKGGDLNYQLKINGVPLERCTSYKYLGLFIDDGLTWKYHIKHVC